jgi:hypothetical protein
MLMAKPTPEELEEENKRLDRMVRRISHMSLWWPKLDES